MKKILNKTVSKQSSMRLVRFFSLLFVTAVMCLSAQTAFSQSTRDLLNRISRMENEIETLNRAVYKGEAPPPGSFSGSSVDSSVAADTQVRLQQLEAELRSLRGRVEEQDHEIRQMRSDLDRALSDMQVQLGDMQNGRNGSAAAPSSSIRSGYTALTPSAAINTQQQDSFTWSSGQSNNASGGTLGQLNQSSDSAAASYENAFSLIKNGQYDAAEQAFQQFIDQNPNHVLTGNAKYWLGESYYVRGDYATAARIFAEGYKQFPKGAKAPDNLLKLGLSLGGMGKKDDACVALGQLGKEYPSGSLPVIRRAEQEMSRLGCS